MAKLSEYEKQLKRKVEAKNNFAEKCFKEKYVTDEERERKARILEEVQFQIEVCEELMKPVTETQIEEWINTCSNVEQVLRKSRTHKFGR